MPTHVSLKCPSRLSLAQYESGELEKLTEMKHTHPRAHTQPHTHVCTEKRRRELNNFVR